MIFGGWFLFLLKNFGRKADGEREKDDRILSV